MLWWKRFDAQYRAVDPWTRTLPRGRDRASWWEAKIHEALFDFGIRPDVVSKVFDPYLRYDANAWATSLEELMSDSRYSEVEAQKKLRILWKTAKAIETMGWDIAAVVEAVPNYWDGVTFPDYD